jgi:hypothetical protein
MTFKLLVEGSIPDSSMTKLTYKMMNWLSVVITMLLIVNIGMKRHGVQEESQKTYVDENLKKIK